MGNHDQIFCGGIRRHFRMVQLPQTFLIGAARMEARAFEKVTNFRSHIVINEKLEPRSAAGQGWKYGDPWAGLPPPILPNCGSARRGGSPSARLSLPPGVTRSVPHAHPVRLAAFSGLP